MARKRSLWLALSVVTLLAGIANADEPEGSPRNPASAAAPPRDFAAHRLIKSKIRGQKTADCLGPLITPWGVQSRSQFSAPAQRADFRDAFSRFRPALRNRKT